MVQLSSVPKIPIYWSRQEKFIALSSGRTSTWLVECHQIFVPKIQLIILHQNPTVRFWFCPRSRTKPRQRKNWNKSNDPFWSLHIISSLSTVSYPLHYIGSIAKNRIFALSCNVAKSVFCTSSVFGRKLYSFVGSPSQECFVFLYASSQFWRWRYSLRYQQASYFSLKLSMMWTLSQVETGWKVWMINTKISRSSLNLSLPLSKVCWELRWSRVGCEDREELCVTFYFSSIKIVNAPLIRIWIW